MEEVGISQLMFWLCTAGCNVQGAKICSFKLAYILYTKILTKTVYFYFFIKIYFNFIA